MEKILISKNKKINYFKKLFYSKIYTFTKETEVDYKEDKYKIVDNKINIVEGNFISLKEELASENTSSKISEEIIDEYIKKVPNFFSEDNDYNFLYWDLRKYISVEVSKYLKTKFLGDKLVKNFNLNYNNIYLQPETIDFTLLNILKNKINCNYKIDFFTIIKFYLSSFFRQVINLLGIIFLPEGKFFFCRNKTNKKKTFKVGYNLFFRQTLENWFGSPDFFLKNQMYDKKNVLYILNSKLTDIKNYKEFESWAQEFKDKNYNIVNLNSLSKLISYKRYFKEIYFKAFKMRFFFLKNYKIMNLLNINSVNTLDQYINWMIFFELFSINNYVSSMVFGENISNLLQSKNSFATNFVYFSTSGPVLDNKEYPNHTDFLQYSFGKYDNFFGNQVSYKQFLSWESTFQNFIETGNFASSYILMSNKTEILKKLNILDKKKIILFSDAAIGKSGVQSTEGFIEYLKAVTKIINNCNDYNYIFKTKSSIEHIYYTIGSQYTKIFDDLLKNKNIKFFDDKKILELDINTHQLIAASEICVSTSLSSLSYDALCAKKKCIIFDPDKIYNHEEYIYTKSKLIYSQNYLELCELLSYWKNDDNLHMVETINKTLIKPNIDKYCDQDSIKRFADNLK
jgi:hypothetical protein